MGTRRSIELAAVFIALLAGRADATRAVDADQLVRAAFDNWRAQSSIADVTMTVHRPDWERTLGMRAWTRGDDDALVRFVAPAKDAGNATLKLGDDTWIFNPKLQQVIKLPASMMSQSWMGSDFSYNDLSKANDLLTKYTHRLIASDESSGHVVYFIEAIPKPDAPVVWGKVVIRIRDDGVLTGETFFDQDMKPVRSMTTEKIADMGGRAYPATMVMRPSNAVGSFTRIDTTAAQFNIPQPSYLFTLSNLQNRRD